MAVKEKDVSVYGFQLSLVSLLMAVAGIIMVLDATSISARAEHLSTFAYLGKQSLRVVLGIVVMFIASRIDYHRMRPISFIALLVTAVFLVLCLVPGTRSIAPLIGGARRWIHLGGISFQPSELARFFLICWTAGYLVRKKEQILDFRNGVLPLVVFSGIFFLLVVRQPDFSSAAIILALVFLTGLLGGIKIRHLMLLGLVALPFITYKCVMQVGYRNERWNSFIEGDADKSGTGYQGYQSRLALGSGGAAGVGLGQSRQKYSFLPAAHTDFIFAIIGEELGFLGATLVLITFCYFCYLGVKIAKGAPDYYGFLLASGLTLMIFASAILNVAVVSGLAPTTGLPLPFFSFGGTNLVITFWAVGILNNISRWKPVAENG